MNVKARLRQIVDGTNTEAGRAFDWTVLALIVYSVITLTLETLPGLSPSARALLHRWEVIATLNFSAEYILWVHIAHKKSSYVRSFYGIVDLVAISPFYITLAVGLGGIDLRVARAFRLLRVFRLLKLARYNKAVARFHRAFVIAREEMVLYLFLTVILLYISAAGIYYFENPVQPEAFKSIFHSLWWALATRTARAGELTLVLDGDFL